MSWAFRSRGRVATISSKAGRSDPSATKDLAGRCGALEEPASPATGGARKRGALEEPASPATGGERKRGELEEPASPATGGARKRGALEAALRCRGITSERMPRSLARS